MFNLICAIGTFMGIMCVGIVLICAIKACSRPKYKSWRRAFKEEIDKF